MSNHRHRLFHAIKSKAFGNFDVQVTSIDVREAWNTLFNEGVTLHSCDKRGSLYYTLCVLYVLQYARVTGPAFLLGLVWVMRFSTDLTSHVSFDSVPHWVMESPDSFIHSLSFNIPINVGASVHWEKLLLPEGNMTNWICVMFVIGILSRQRINTCTEDYRVYKKALFQIQVDITYWNTVFR